jgi:hypothetical protein
MSKFSLYHDGPSPTVFPNTVCPTKPHLSPLTLHTSDLEGCAVHALDVVLEINDVLEN